MTFRIHLLLFLACAVYAALLNRRCVYEWYHPDRTILTVIGGDLLIGWALALMCGVGALPWAILCPYVTLHITASIPIGIWQARQVKRRQGVRRKISKGD